MGLELTFVFEPSLEKDDLRKRDLALARAKSHSAHWIHKSRASTTRSFIAPSRGGTFLPHPSFVRYKRRRTSQRAEDTVESKPIAIVSAPMLRSPTYSTYLKETYSHHPKSALHISDLCEFCLSYPRTSSLLLQDWLTGCSLFILWAGVLLASLQNRGRNCPV